MKSQPVAKGAWRRRMWFDAETRRRGARRGGPGGRERANSRPWCGGDSGGAELRSDWQGGGCSTQGWRRVNGGGKGAWRRRMWFDAETRRLGARRGGPGGRERDEFAPWRGGDSGGSELRSDRQAEACPTKA